MSEKTSLSNNSRKYFNLFWAIGILTLIILIIFTLVYPSQSGLGRAFDAFVVLIISRYIAIGLGLICLFLRLIKILKDRHHILYAVSAVLNLFIGIAAIIMNFFDMADKSWLTACLPNLLIGAVIFGDLLLPVSPRNTNSTE